MVRFAEFDAGTDDYPVMVAINPDTVQSVTRMDYDDTKCTQVVLTTGETHMVNADYNEVLLKLRSAK